MSTIESHARAPQGDLLRLDGRLRNLAFTRLSVRKSSRESFSDDPMEDKNGCAVNLPSNKYISTTCLKQKPDSIVPYQSSGGQRLKHTFARFVRADRKSD